MKTNFSQDNIVRLIKIILEKIKTFDPFGIAAQSAYYFLFSIFPLLMFMVTLLPYFNIEVAVLTRQLQNSFLPTDLVNTIGEFLTMVLNEKDSSLSIVAFLLTIWSSSTAMNSIVKSINRIYEDQFSRNGIIFRLMGIGFTIGFVVVIIANFIIFTFGDRFFEFMHLEAFIFILAILKFFALPILLFSSLYTLYRFSPSIKLSRIDVMPGAIFSSLSFISFSVIFSKYINVFSSSFTKYGIFSSIMLMMLWFFSIGLIIMFGAIINSAIRDLRIENSQNKSK